MEENADIFCIQEVKASATTIDPVLRDIAGYTLYPHYSRKKGHHGTAYYSKVAPVSISCEIGDMEADGEGRVLMLEYPAFYLVNAYVPNAGRDLTRLEYKLKFNEAFLAYCEGLRARKDLIVCGDLNVAHRDIDIANPKRNASTAGFTPEERDSFTRFLAAGYIDTFREFVEEGGHYIWWSQRSNAKERNIGWRLDYFLINKEFRPALASSEILREVDVADHCPIKLIIDLSAGS